MRDLINESDFSNIKLPTNCADCPFSFLNEEYLLYCPLLNDIVDKDRCPFNKDDTWLKLFYLVVLLSSDKENFNKLIKELSNNKEKEE